MGGTGKEDLRFVFALRRRQHCRTAAAALPPPPSSKQASQSSAAGRQTASSRTRHHVSVAARATPSSAFSASYAASRAAFCGTTFIALAPHPA